MVSDHTVQLTHTNECVYSSYKKVGNVWKCGRREDSFMKYSVIIAELFCHKCIEWRWM